MPSGHTIGLLCPEYGTRSKRVDRKGGTDVSPQDQRLKHEGAAGQRFDVHVRGGGEPPYKGAGWIVFAAMMFVLAGCLSIIWGIAAVSSSHFFVANATYILSDLNTWVGS